MGPNWVGEEGAVGAVPSWAIRLRKEFFTLAGSWSVNSGVLTGAGVPFGGTSLIQLTGVTDNGPYTVQADMTASNISFAATAIAPTARALGLNPVAMPQGKKKSMMITE
mgnify:CR=1 FL=1